MSLQFCWCIPLFTITGHEQMLIWPVNHTSLLPSVYYYRVSHTSFSPLVNHNASILDLINRLWARQCLSCREASIWLAQESLASNSIMQSSTSNWRSRTSDGRSHTSNRRPRTSDGRSHTSNRKPAIQTGDPILQTGDPSLQTGIPPIAMSYPAE